MFNISDLMSFITDLVHGVDSQHDEDVHDVVRVKATVYCPGEPFFRNMHRADHTTA